MKTYCRICEAHCGLEIEVDETSQAIIQVRPDKEHPISKGYACVKGISLGDIHHDPERLNYPLKKVGDDWQRISWQQALGEIGSKVKSIKKQHSPRAIAMYAGNPNFFNFKSVMYVHDFLKSIGSPNLFSSHSIDANNKLYTAMKVYGRSMVHPIPDFEHTDFFMCLGSNPVVSQMSYLLIPNALATLQAIEKRGGRVVMVDPRKTETADKVGEHVFIRPGTDVYLLLALLHVLGQEYRPDLSRFNSEAEGAETFLKLGKDWTPERCAALTGISAEAIRDIAKQYCEADGASLYMSTGVNMGPFGSICYWLIQGLSLLSGNLDSKGGMVFSQGAFDAIKLAEDLGIGGEESDRTLKDSWGKVASCFPSNTLVDEIQIDHPDKIRALFVMAGNPVHSIPGAELDTALSELELVVAIDIYKNETAAYADYILPATDMLERSDFPVSWTNLRPVPHVQYTDSVVPAKFERREEWEILSDLALACGASPIGLNTCNLLAHINRLLRYLPGDKRITPDTVLSLILRKGGHVTLKQLKADPLGVMLPENVTGKFLGKRVPASSGKMNLAPAELLADTSRLGLIEQTLKSQSGLVLIGQRERKTHNSWMHHAPHIKHKKVNAVTMHPQDAEQRNIVHGELAVIGGNGKELSLLVKISDEVMPGVVVVPHGWGHAASGTDAARRAGGVNINHVIAGGTSNMEPVSGQSIMLGHCVEVRRAD
jgi:anaerobic selenocysteine-containing dehydrogenase